MLKIGGLGYHLEYVMQTPEKLVNLQKVALSKSLVKATVNQIPGTRCKPNSRLPFYGDPGEDFDPSLLYPHLQHTEVPHDSLCGWFYCPRPRDRRLFRRDIPMFPCTVCMG